MSRISDPPCNMNQLATAGQLLKISNWEHIPYFSWRHYHKIFWRGQPYLASYVIIKATNALDAKRYRCRPSYMWSLTIFSNYSSHSVLAITIYLFAQNPFPSLPFSSKKIGNCLNLFQPSLTTLSLNLYVSK